MKKVIVETYDDNTIALDTKIDSELERKATKNLSTEFRILKVMC
ncbi:MAG: hypothetical protein R3A12_10220 [Ignavibacteria bacterium]